MKISPFKVAETRFSFRKSAKKVVPFSSRIDVSSG